LHLCLRLPWTVNKGRGPRTPCKCASASRARVCCCVHTPCNCPTAARVHKCRHPRSPCICTCCTARVHTARRACVCRRRPSRGPPSRSRPVLRLLRVLGQHDDKTSVRKLPFGTFRSEEDCSSHVPMRKVPTRQLPTAACCGAPHEAPSQHGRQFSPPEHPHLSENRNRPFYR